MNQQSTSVQIGDIEARLYELRSHLVTLKGNLRGKSYTPLVPLDLARYSANKMPIGQERNFDVVCAAWGEPLSTYLANSRDNYVLTNQQTQARGYWSIGHFKISWYKLYAGLMQPRGVCAAYRLPWRSQPRLISMPSTVLIEFRPGKSPRSPTTH